MYYIYIPDMGVVWKRNWRGPPEYCTSLFVKTCMYRDSKSATNQNASYAYVHICVYDSSAQLIRRPFQPDAALRAPIFVCALTVA